MQQQFDELAKSLAEAVSRREALRRLGGGLAGVLLGSLGLGKAWGQNPNQSHFGALCQDCCRDKVRAGPRMRPCLGACEACQGDCGRVCASPTSDNVVCCAPGNQCCRGGCTDVSIDSNNCGTCDRACPTGAVCCDNGRGCCPRTNETDCCDGECVNLLVNGAHCGRCHNRCSTAVGTTEVCCNGVCCDPGQACVNGHCAECQETADCPTGIGLTCCNGKCTSTQADPFNCGSCGNICPAAQFGCANGICG
jgi:hypothetical protein